MTEEACRACGADELGVAFEGVIRGHRTNYMICARCRSLQVPQPTWLEQAHQDMDGSDTGAAQRCIEVARLVRLMRRARLLSARARVLDVGSGSGLLVRLLRDHGFDAWASEPYREAEFARPFVVRDITTSADEKYELVSLVEVLEHLLAPLELVQAAQSVLAPSGGILITTMLFDSAVHDASWWYLDPEAGDHVTFFSLAGLNFLAQRAGLLVESDGEGRHFLSSGTRQASRWRRALRRHGLETRLLRRWGIAPGWQFINQDAELSQRVAK